MDINAIYLMSVTGFIALLTISACYCKKRRGALNTAVVILPYHASIMFGQSEPVGVSHIDVHVDDQKSTPA